MGLEVGGIVYLTADEVAERAGISRQTLWRWRQEGRVPAGRRYRGRRLLFTEGELGLILEFAHRIEPAEIGPVQVSSSQDLETAFLK